MKNVILSIFFLIVLIQFVSCDNKTNESGYAVDYSSTLLKERESKDYNLKNDSHSPFNRDPDAKFDNLKYFEPDTNYIFRSRLHRFETKDTITIMGTRGEKRTAIKEGYIVLMHQNQEHRLNVYKSFGPNGEPYYSMWFTDETTGKETYHIGRYLDFDFVPDEDFVYVIDFNRAYNPYCAYSELFTCPIPTEDDHINFAIKAGEKNFH